MLDRHGLAPLHVSTHSRPKAAGAFPPKLDRQTMFQHTAARRRLAKPATSPKSRAFVSTHSRPKAAGKVTGKGLVSDTVSTHSRPKAAG